MAHSKNIRLSLLKLTCIGLAVPAAIAPHMVFAQDKPSALKSDASFTSVRELELKNRQAQINQLKKVLDQKEDKLESLKKQVKSQTNSKAYHKELKKELAKKDKEAKLLKEKIETLQGNASFSAAREQEIETLMGEMENVFAQYDALRQKNQDLEAKLKADAQKAQTLEAQLRQAKQEFEKAQEQFAQIQAQSGMSLQEEEALKLKAQNFEQAITQEQEKYAALQERTKMLETSLNDVARREAMQQKLFQEELARREREIAQAQADKYNTLLQEQIAKNKALQSAVASVQESPKQQLQDNVSAVASSATQGSQSRPYEVIKTASSYRVPLPVPKPSMIAKRQALAAQKAANIQPYKPSPNELAKLSGNRPEPTQSIMQRSAQHADDFYEAQMSSAPSIARVPNEQLAYEDQHTVMSEAQMWEQQMMQGTSSQHHEYAAAAPQAGHSEDHPSRQAAQAMNNVQTSLYPTNSGEASSREQAIDNADVSNIQTMSQEQINENFDPNFGKDEKLYYSPAVDMYGLIQTTYGYVPQTFGLLSDVSDAQRLVYQWQEGDTFSSAEQKPIEQGQDFDALTQEYLVQTENRCEGDFAAISTDTRDIGKLRADSYDIACIIGDKGVNAAASLLFFEYNGTFNIVSHESSTKHVDLSMDKREKIIETFERASFL